MELMTTTAEQAKAILEAGNRKIVLKNGYAVKWINLNNDTCYAEKGAHGSTFDNENVEFFIKVPARAKTVF